MPQHPQLNILASGSGGNCASIKLENSTILVDCGISYSMATKRLALRGQSPEDIDAIVLTHNHSDHIKGLARWLSVHPDIPVYASKETGREVKAVIECVDFRRLLPGQFMRIRGFEFYPFSVSHDAAGPLGFRIETSRGTLGVATDLGDYDASLVDALKDVNALMLEANHDSTLLARGPYPAFLKRRIGGRRGHLSNDQARRLLEEVLHDGLKAVILTHMSATNNETLLAQNSMAEVLVGTDTIVSTASQQTGAPTLKVVGAESTISGPQISLF